MCIGHRKPDESKPSSELYCIELTRHKGDLGLSIVLPATCELMARREALRLFPEYKHNLVLMQVYPALYVEYDWDSGRCVIAKRERSPEVPPCVVAATKSKRKRLPRIEEGGSE